MAGTAAGYLLPEWPVPTGVRAACTLRTGGVSRPPFDTLNLGAAIGDSEECVAENRRRVRTSLVLPSEPVWLQQVHGTAVVNIDEIDRALAHRVPTADAAVARTPGRVCAVRTADCMPVLLAAHDGSAVAAAHAGWRGLSAGVLEASLRELGCAAAAVMAWMGPAIGPDHFEVGEEVYAAFTTADAEARQAFRPNARGRWQCDLYALARLRLMRAGVRHIFGGGLCTYSDAQRFFSYRRDGQCGRMAALIWMES